MAVLGRHQVESCIQIEEDTLQQIGFFPQDYLQYMFPHCQRVKYQNGEKIQRKMANAKKCLA